MKKQLNGAQILIEALIEQGADTIFGYPGGSVLNIYDALYENRDRIRHIITSHEQGAAHAADGYARSSGRTGVVLATSGPGATNLVTGIATAYMDSVPMVAITGNVPLSLIGRDSFQEIDICGITMPITKHNYIVKDAAELAATVREAFTIASSGRPGPVLIDIPKDITAQVVEYEPAGKFRLRENPSASAGDIETAARMISQSSRPLIFAGGGVVWSNATKELKALSERIDAPVALSFMGLGAIPAEDEANLGMIGMHGTPVSNRACYECDLLITVGARFSDRVSGNRVKFAPSAKIIHIDLDASEHGKNVRVDLPITGGAADTMQRLTEAVGQRSNSEWRQRLSEYKKAHPVPVPPENGCVEPRHLLRALSEMAGKDAIIVTDVGQHQMFTAQHYSFSTPRSFISSGGLGTMGYGLGAAIGAKVANPDRTVILVTGDGSFHMNMNEMAAAVSECLGIVVLVMNNGVLGMVRQWQRLFYKGRYSCTSIERKTDFSLLAQAFGAQGLRMETRTQMRPVIEQAIQAAQNGPVIVDCVIHRDDHVFPIIPPNGEATDIILSEEEAL